MLAIFVNLETVDPSLILKIVKEIESELIADGNKEKNYLRLVYFESPLELENSNLKDDNSQTIRGIELNEYNTQIDKVKQKIKDILIKNHISKYIVRNDPINQNTLFIVKRSTLNLTDEVHCRHCGMEFEDEIQLGNHLRIHYMI
ncbi:conserved protein of unknown function [Candidatus Nitrosocosmicus franklandus]|uniref:C2H2-type domain-containing protein n=1 Tax=Candidatus Nitrosocosmicus franklandianus TaxID=1798806 RepID=A0A484ICD9_9ARCH|nr:conserved protein of unknown function [Candidatus Nitrosocosmicus franklandus]